MPYFNRFIIIIYVSKICIICKRFCNTVRLLARNMSEITSPTLRHTLFTISLVGHTFFKTMLHRSIITFYTRVKYQPIYCTTLGHKSLHLMNFVYYHVIKMLPYLPNADECSKTRTMLLEKFEITFCSSWKSNSGPRDHS